jgi:uncharacterized protein (DUF305 family)
MAPSAGQLPDLSLDQLVELERRAAERAARDDGGGGTDDPDDEHGDGHGDDDVVLPWWQHPMNIVTMLVAGVLIAGMIGWLVGDARSQPQYGATDVGFLHDMRFHHEQAVYMSFVFQDLPDTNRGLDTIAESIVMGQSMDIGRMIQLLREFGEPEAADLQAPSMAWMGMAMPIDQMPGLASEDDLVALQSASGAEADALFVELMVAHHEGGVHMAEFAAENAENPEVRAMAQSMAASQTDEINELLAQID